MKFDSNIYVWQWVYTVVPANAIELGCTTQAWVSQQLANRSQSSPFTAPVKAIYLYGGPRLMIKKHSLTNLGLKPSDFTLLSTIKYKYNLCTIYVIS